MHETSEDTRDEGGDGPPQGLRRLGWREALAAVGVAVSVTGAVAVFESTNEAGSAALVATGVGCIALAALWNRVKSVEAGGMKVELVEVAQRKLTAAKDADLRGDRTEAARLRSEAEELLALAAPLAADYEFERGRLPPGPQRTARMEQVVDKARKEARSARDAGHPLDRNEVKKLFGSGKKGDRVSALAFMQGDPDLVDARIVLGVLAAPLSPFEETQAFAVAEALSRSPLLEPEVSRRLLDAAVAALEGDRLRSSRSRRSHAEAIRRTLGPE